MKTYIKTKDGYFTVFGWDFRWNFNKACALPFPNGLHLSLSTAKAFLKQKGIGFQVVQEEANR